MSLTAWLSDMHVYDPAKMSWTELYSSSPPSARYGHGLTSIEGKIYMHGGYGYIVDTDGYGKWMA